MRQFPFNELNARDQRLRGLYSQFQIAPTDTKNLRHKDVRESLESLAKFSESAHEQHLLKLRELGRSFEGRSLQLASIGSGPRQVLLWSQMHGDESTHTAVLLDVLSTLVDATSWPNTEDELLEKCTLHFLPMLNPDGAERQTRKNAQGHDINRDAVDLATPEGRVLWSTVNEIRPQFGFNLHNQRADKMVADSGKVAVVSVLAPPLDAEETTTAGIVRAKQLSLEMFAAGERLLPGHSTRYEAGYMPTAFGEWVQSRGAVTALLEAGGWPEGETNWLVELHYVVLMSALLAIGHDKLKTIDANLYETLPLNT